MGFSLWGREDANQGQGSLIEMREVYVSNIYIYIYINKYIYIYKYIKIYYIYKAVIYKQYVNIYVYVIIYHNISIWLVSFLNNVTMDSEGKKRFPCSKPIRVHCL